MLIMAEDFLLWMRIAVGSIDLSISFILIYYYVQATYHSDTFLSAWWCRLAIILVLLAGWSQLAMAIGSHQVASVAFLLHFVSMVIVACYLPGSFHVIFQAPTREEMRAIKDRLQGEIMLRRKMEEDVIPKIEKIRSRAKTIAEILSREIVSVDKGLKAAAQETDITRIVDRLSEVNRMLDVRTQVTTEINLLIIDLEGVMLWRRS